MFNKLIDTATKTASVVGNTALRSVKVVHENWDPLWGMMPYVKNQVKNRFFNKTPDNAGKTYHYEG